MKFKSQFSKRLKLNGKGYNIVGEVIYVINNGEGQIKIYDNLDNLEFEREYKIGKIGKGIKNEYYKNGTLKNEYIYSEGIVEGWKDYSSKGQIKFEGNYING